jgi:glycosyltransferase involved in cell wall biosynthesis
MTENKRQQALDLNHSFSDLNIEVVTETYPPEINGVAHTISMLIGELRKNNHLVNVIRPQQPSDFTSHQIQKQNSNQDVLVKSFPIPLYSELRMGIPAKTMLLERWGKTKPDIVHIATEGPLGWSAAKAARSLNIPVTSDFRTNFHDYSSFYRLGFLEPLIMAYMRYFHNATDCTMVPTEKLKQELEQAGLHNLRVMPRGVDTGHFSDQLRSNQLRASWNAEPFDVVLLSVGRLAVEKNLDLLIKSYIHAKNIEPRTKLVVVGDGPLRESLQKKCPEAIFVGKKSGLELAKYYASADMFVFPSLTETFGNVTIEAMASGLAVIAYRHAAAGDLIISGDNGITVEPGDENAFVRAVITTLMNQSLIRRLGNAAVKTAKHQSWEEIVRRTECLWREIILEKNQTQDCHENVIIST